MNKQLLLLIKGSEDLWLYFTHVDIHAGCSAGETTQRDVRDRICSKHTIEHELLFQRKALRDGKLFMIRLTTFRSTESRAIIGSEWFCWGCFCAEQMTDDYIHQDMMLSGKTTQMDYILRNEQEEGTKRSI